ncbi:hypothetical protein AHAS_Ahas06G0197800 [Arachis hypogaea]
MVLKIGPTSRFNRHPQSSPPFEFQQQPPPTIPLQSSNSSPNPSLLSLSVALSVRARFVAVGHAASLILVVGYCRFAAPHRGSSLLLGSLPLVLAASLLLVVSPSPLLAGVVSASMLRTVSNRHCFSVVASLFRVESRSRRGYLLSLVSASTIASFRSQVSSLFFSASSLQPSQVSSLSL